MRRLALLWLFGLSACSQRPDAGQPEVAASASPVVARQTEGEAKVVPTTLELVANGLVIPEEGGAAAQQATFGSAREDVERIVGAVAGPVGASNQPNDCGLATTSYEGLALHFRDDRFVGYYANAPYLPKISRTQMLEDPAVVMVDGSTIDGEFIVERGGQAISGVFVGDEIRGLWAGENCIAR